MLPPGSRRTITRPSSFRHSPVTVTVAYPSSYERPIRSALGFLRRPVRFKRKGNAICLVFIGASQADSALLSLESNFVATGCPKRGISRTAYNSEVLRRRERDEKSELILCVALDDLKRNPGVGEDLPPSHAASFRDCLPCGRQSPPFGLLALK